MPGKTKWIICLDGTSNSEHLNKSLTNVSIIRQCIAKNYTPKEGETDARQVTYYHDGIGTGFKNPLNVLQQALGDGIDRIILDAYHYLCQNYQGGDEIFLIGFSRGAYAARCVADLVNYEGLLLYGGRDEIHAIYEHWSKNASVKREETPHRRREREYPMITACALWDTVGSIGTPIWKGILGRRFKFVHSKLPANVEHVVQALSLHEHRYHFSPLVVHPTKQNPDQSTTTNKQTLEQCWFAGYHADIGGGCKKDALAHFALVWMIAKLEERLTFNTNNLYNTGNPTTGNPTTGNPINNENLDNHTRMPVTWIVGGRCGIRLQNGTPRLPVNDSMSFGFMAGGSKYRLPQMEFWDENGPYYTKPGKTLRSEEKIHATTRFLLKNKLVEPFASVNGIAEQPTEVPEGSWQWTLHSKIKGWRNKFFRQPKGDEEPNIIQECGLTNTEKEILIRWVGSENSNIDETYYPVTSKSPGSVLVFLRRWLHPQPIPIKPANQ